jgi:two-component system NtrC family sensor kinase
LAVEDVPSADARRFATTIGRQAERIANIIRQLLGFARAGRGERKPQNLVEEVTHGVKLLEPIATKKCAELRIIAPQDDICVIADAQQLEQVVTNLVVNALQAVSAGGHVEVRVFRQTQGAPQSDTQLAGDFAGFSVSDDGAGIQEENLERVFEPFFTTKDVGEGTGLGLSVTHGIVSELGGRIDVQSQPGKGSCFSVYLPLSASHEAVTADRPASIAVPIAPGSS